MSLENWSNYGFVLESLRRFWNFDLREVCVFYVCWRSVSKTIIYVRNSFVAHHNRDSSRECRIFTTSRKLDFFLQCFKSPKTFSQSVSRCPIIAPWSFAPKNSRLAVSHFSVAAYSLFLLSELFKTSLRLLRGCTELIC